MAVGQQIPAGLHCIIQLFWTHAPAMSELAAAIELLLPPICTQRIERLLQPCPHCLSSILPVGRPRLANVAASYQTQTTDAMMKYVHITHRIISNSHDKCVYLVLYFFYWVLIEDFKIRISKSI